MVRWFRWTDGFAVVGILLLVVATPAYVAQGAVEQDLSAGRSFTLPAPRLGMTLEQEILFDHVDHGVVVAGPVTKVTFRSPREGEGPDGSLYVREETRLPLAVDLGWGTLHTVPGTWRLYFSDEGLPIGSESHEFLAYEEGGPPLEQSVTGRVHDAAQHPSNRWAHTEIEYHPVAARLAVQELTHELGGSGFALPQKETAYQRVFSDTAAIHRGFELFADDYDASFWDGRDDGLCTECYGWPAELRSLSFHGLERGVDYRFDQRDRWLASGWPEPVGEFSSAYDPKTGALIADIHVLPASLTAGSGPPLPLAYRPFHGGGDIQNVPEDDPESLPRVSLRSLQDDATPLFGRVALIHLRDALREDQAPDAVATFAEKAFITDFLWVSEAPERIDAPLTKSLLPVLAQQPQDPALRTRSTWVVALTDDDGDRGIAEVTLLDGPDGVTVEQVADVCVDGPGASAWALREIDCTRARIHVPLDTLVATPAAAIGRAATIAHRDVPPADPDRGPFTSFGYLGTGRDITDKDYDTATSWAILPQHAPRANAAFVRAGVVLSAGIASWHDNTTATESVFGSLDLRDGSLIRNIVRAEGREPPQAEPSAALLGTADMFQRVSPVPRGLVASGAALVVVAVSVRIAAALKLAGMPAPFVGLYAKLAKADVLLHRRREDIVQFLVQEPGATRNEVNAALGYGWGATVHHVETLRRNGILVATHVHGHRHYFPVDLNLGASERRVIAARRSGPSAALLDAVAAKPGANLKELSEVVGTKPAAVSRIGSRLAKEGFVEKRRDGMAVRFYPTETVVATG